MNTTFAFGYLLKAANAGNPTAQSLVASMYSQGIATEVNQAKAVLYHTFAIKGGEPSSQMALAYRKYYGIGVAKDCYAAVNYYKAVAQEVLVGYNSVLSADVYRDRLGEDNKLAGTQNDILQYYRLSADSGDLDARVGKIPSFI